MCGRYTQTLDIEALQERFGFVSRHRSLTRRYNIAPGQDAPVVVRLGERRPWGPHTPQGRREADGSRRLGLLRWGLVPRWAKDPRIGHRMINARAETAAEKPAYRRPFERSRCLVLADGFYEWDKKGKTKTPVRFTLKDRSPFAFAGLWDECPAPGGKVLRSFTILTAKAEGPVREVHDRMPVILRPEAEEAWIDPRTAKTRLQDLLRPADPRSLDACEVGPRVNSTAHDDPACVEPRSAAKDAPEAPESGQFELGL